MRRLVTPRLCDSLIERLIEGLADRLPAREIRSAGAPYLDRYLVCRVPGWLGGGAVYLHRFHASDPDESVHDHPWPWSCSVILSGSYTERRLEGFNTATGLRYTARRRRAFVPGLIRGDDFHRVILDADGERPPRPVWTLFAHGPWQKRWGFLRTRKRKEGAQTIEDVFSIDRYPVTRTDDDDGLGWSRTGFRGRDLRELRAAAALSGRAYGQQAAE